VKGFYPLLEVCNSAKRRGDVEEKEQTEFRLILEKLLKDVDNKRCAECGTAAPRWASANLGVFLCIKCSGIHRAMGTHISFIRSVSLDRWKPEEIAFIQSMGNANAAQVWEAKLPAEYRRPSSNESLSLEKFIRDKYEYKRYFKPPAVDKTPTITIKQEIPPATPPLRSATNNIVPPGPRPNTPQKTIPINSPAPPINNTVLQLDPFAVKQSTQTTSPFPSPSASLFPTSDFPDPLPQSTKPPDSNNNPVVDVNLLKKSNIMSMFDVQNEQQKQQQQQQQQQQQMLLQQQMYYSGSPQLYYSTSGGLIPVMYGPQAYAPGTVVYPQHFQ